MGKDIKNKSKILPSSVERQMMLASGRVQYAPSVRKILAEAGIELIPRRVKKFKRRISFEDFIAAKEDWDRRKQIKDDFIKQKQEKAAKRKPKYAKNKQDEEKPKKEKKRKRPKNNPFRSKDPWAGTKVSCSLWTVKKR